MEWSLLNTFCTYITFPLRLPLLCKVVHWSISYVVLQGCPVRQGIVSAGRGIGSCLWIMRLGARLRPLWWWQARIWSFGIHFSRWFDVLPFCRLLEYGPVCRNYNIPFSYWGSLLYSDGVCLLRNLGMVWWACILVCDRVFLLVEECLYDYAKIRVLRFRVLVLRSELWVGCWLDIGKSPKLAPARYQYISKASTQSIWTNPIIGFHFSWSWLVLRTDQLTAQAVPPVHNNQQHFSPIYQLRKSCSL